MRILKPFDYFEPVTVKDAVELMAKYGDKAQLLAGGVDLIPRMRKGSIKADYLVNLQRIPALEYVKDDGVNGLQFGAMARLRTLESTKALQSNYPALYDAIHQITSVQAKYMGTAVGNICVATPASDVATALMALGVEVKIAGPDGERREPMDKFCVGYLRTCLKVGEMVTAVYLPGLKQGTGTAFLNLVRTHADIAKVSVAVVLTIKNNVCAEARIAIGAAGPTVFSATKAEAVLKGQTITPEAINKAAEVAAGETNAITDVRSTADYRRDMAGVLVRRALEKALEKAKA